MRNFQTKILNDQTFPQRYDNIPSTEEGTSLIFIHDAWIRFYVYIYIQAEYESHASPTFILARIYIIGPPVYCRVLAIYR